MAPFDLAIFLRGVAENIDFSEWFLCKHFDVFLGGHKVITNLVNGRRRGGGKNGLVLIKPIEKMKPDGTAQAQS